MRMIFQKLRQSVQNPDTQLGAAIVSTSHLRRYHDDFWKNQNATFDGPYYYEARRKLTWAGIRYDIYALPGEAGDDPFQKNFSRDRMERQMRRYENEIRADHEKNPRYNSLSGDKHHISLTLDRNAAPIAAPQLKPARALGGLEGMR